MTRREQSPGLIRAAIAPVALGLIVAGATACSRPREASEAAKTAPPAPITISIVGTNDLHGHVESLPTLGGFLRVLRAVRGADGVVLLDAGDMFQGTLESNLGEGA